MFKKRLVISKIVVSVIIIFFVAFLSSYGTYYLTIKSNKISGESNNTKQTDIKIDDDFNTITSTIKAYAQNTLKAENSKLNEMVDNIVVDIQNILRSQYFYKLNDNTFNNDVLSVKIKDTVRLTGCTIRKIEFTMKDDNHFISEYFLQYIGDTIIFSDRKEPLNSEHDLKAFETKDGIIGFLTYKDKNRYSVISDSNVYTSYKADVFRIDNNKFVFTENVNIPISSTKDGRLDFIQQDNSIKAVIIEDYKGTVAASPFDSSTNSFDFESSDLISKETDQIMTGGLLLGLSDNNGVIRTLWIRQKNKKIYCDEVKDQIIFPRGKVLYGVKNYTFNQEITEGTGEDVSKIGSLDYKKLLCAPLGTDCSDKLVNMLSPLPDDGYYSSNDVPLFVGEDYISYAQIQSFSGGGTFTGQDVIVRFDKLDKLSDFKQDYSKDRALKSNFKQTYLADLIFGASSKSLYQSDLDDLDTSYNSFLDFKQLAIKRDDCNWSLMMPIMSRFYNYGNGSFGTHIDNFAICSNNVPSYIAPKSNSILIEEDWFIPETEDNGKYPKDILKFPKDDVVLLFRDYNFRLMMFENDADKTTKFQFDIPAKADEFIVSINWANGEKIADWESAIANIKK